jgi:hypothetical protein
MFFSGKNQSNKEIAGFEALAAVDMKNSVSWDTTSCSQLKVNRRFGRTRLYLQRRRKSQAKNQHKAGSKQCLFLVLYLACPILRS